MIRTAWKIDPAIVVHFPRRFVHPIIEKEAGRWVRAHSREVIDYPEALQFLIGDRLDLGVTRDLKVCCAIDCPTKALLTTFVVCPSVGARDTNPCNYIFRTPL